MPSSNPIYRVILIIFMESRVALSLPNLGSILQALFLILPSNESELRKEMVILLQPEAASFLLFTVGSYRLHLHSRSRERCPSTLPMQHSESMAIWHAAGPKKRLEPSVMSRLACAFSPRWPAAVNQSLDCVAFFKVPEHRSEPLTSVSNFSIAVFFFFFLHCTSV